MVWLASDARSAFAAADSRTILVKMTLVLATTWVRRGVAAQFPTKYDIDEAELNRISKLAKLQLEDAQEDLNFAQRTTRGAGEGNSDDVEDESPSNAIFGSASQEDDELGEYHLDDYDKEPVDAQGEKFVMFGNVRSLAYHAQNEEDPYLVLPPGEEEDDEEREELQIFPEDNLLLAAKVEDEVAHLEVYVYEDEADNLYVHHDIMLPAVPLCVEWLDLPVGKNPESRTSGNFVAIGTMSPEIEIWDLDVVDSMYPNAILGQEPVESSQANGTFEGKGKKKKKKRPKANDDYHVDAVLALAANREHRNLLASASADKTVKLWDLNTAKCAKSYSMHKGKVCALDWHPKEATLLLSGSYDRTVTATDMRAPEAKAPQWTVEADVEKVRWNLHDPNYFYVTTESGTVHYYDARDIPRPEGFSKPIWTLQAHDGAVSAFDINATIANFLVTGSDDKLVKLWDVSDNKPSMVVSRNFDTGRIFAAQFAPDPEVSFRLSVAGSKGTIQVWDTSTNAAVRRTFSTRVKMPEGDVKDRTVRVYEASGDEEDEEDDEDGGVKTIGPDGEGWESMDED